MAAIRCMTDSISLACSNAGTWNAYCAFLCVRCVTVLMPSGHRLEPTEPVGEIERKRLDEEPVGSEANSNQRMSLSVFPALKTVTSSVFSSVV